jgi:hypothetical protein
MPTKAPKRIGPGRPKKVIDWPAVAKLCLIHCTEEEIANCLETTVETLHARCKDDHGVKFSEYYAEKAAHGKKSLRRKQNQMALKGDRVMLIWLGKQWLGQRDEQHIKTSAEPNAEDVRQLTTEQIRAELARIEKERDGTATGSK